MDRVVAFTDGTAEPNPGPAAIGVVIKNRQDRVVTTISQSIGRATNNQAEYRAIIAALETALRLGATHIHVRSDSELVVRQIEGNYRVKSAALKSLHQQVRQLIARCQAFQITHIPREQNQQADRLAAAALPRATPIHHKPGAIP